VNLETKKKDKIIATFLVIYCLVTLVPFYFLIVRSFTPTIESTEFHYWVPPRRPLSMNARVGDLATVYNISTRDFRKAMGIRGYVSPQYKLSKIAKKYEIEEQKIVDYLEPKVHWNGVLTVIDHGIVRAVFGSVFVTGTSTFLGGLLGIMTGYVLAGFRQRWHLFVYNLYLLQLIIPPIMVILPQYMILSKWLGLSDSYWAIILIHLKGGAISTMIFTTYISTIPKELRESVSMDGGKHYHYFLYVLIPLAVTPFAVYASVTMPLVWNDLLFGLVFLHPAKYYLPPFVAAIGGTYTTNFEAIFSGVTISLVPILIVYIAFQKMFIRSAMSGAVKG
jgi:ABC-type glycerol-3-phosphate transport system permease component